jgi:hypothetical protein
MIICTMIESTGKNRQDLRTNPNIIRESEKVVIFRQATPQKSCSMLPG